MARANSPFAQFTSSATRVLSGGSVFIYFADTTNLVPLFTKDTDDPSFALSNPFDLGDSGEIPDVFFADGTATRWDVFDSVGNLYDTADNVLSFSLHNELYNPAQTYATGEAVVDAGRRYVSNQDENKGQDVTDTIWWTLVPLQGVYNATVGYLIGDICVVNGITYVSRTGTVGTPNLNNNPPDKYDDWANTSGIGYHTVVYRTQGMDLPPDGSSPEPAIPKSSIIAPASARVSAGMSFTHSENTQAQFTIPAPKSYDPTQPLLIRVDAIRGTNTGGTVAKWSVGCNAFNTGDFVTASWPEGGDGLMTIEGVGKFASTPFFPITPSGSVQEESLLNFRIRRLATDVQDDVTDPLTAAQVVIQYANKSSVDA